MIVKGYRRKIIFGIPMLVSFIIVGIFMVLQNEMDTYFVPIVFAFAFAGGVVFWIIQLTREKKERQAENFRRKNK